MARREERVSRINTRGAVDLDLAAREGRAATAVPVVALAFGVSDAAQALPDSRATDKGKMAAGRAPSRKVHKVRTKVATLKPRQDRHRARVEMAKQQTAREIRAASSAEDKVGEANSAAVSSLAVEARAADSSSYD